MQQVFAVYRKELLEAVADRQSFRGTALQSIIFFGMSGVFLPWRSGALLWQSLPMMLTLYALLPTVIATSVAADAFAGELERGTLESLLATAVTDGAVFWGKALNAVTMSTTLSCACLLSAALLTVEVNHLPVSTVRPSTVAMVLLGHIGISTVMTAVAIYISARMKVARAAQQALSLGTLVGVFCLGLARRYLVAGQSMKIIMGEVGLIVTGCIALTFMARFFRRDTIFEDA